MKKFKQEKSFHHPLRGSKRLESLYCFFLKYIFIKVALQQYILLKSATKYILSYLNGLRTNLTQHRRKACWCEEPPDGATLNNYKNI